MTTTLDRPTRAQRIEALLQRSFGPCLVEVVDESARHAGHAGNPDGAGETHYAVRVVSAVFAGQGRVARSRAVHAALASEFEDGLHALSLRLAAPGDA